jgi:hypothetical protein
MEDKMEICKNKWYSILMKISNIKLPELWAIKEEMMITR